jgi:hypothetical protein
MREGVKTSKIFSRSYGRGGLGEEKGGEARSVSDRIGDQKGGEESPKSV